MLSFMTFQSTISAISRLGSVALVVLLTACGSAEGTLEFDQKLQGAWKTACVGRKIKALSITDNYFTKSTSYYKDAICEVPTYAIRNIWQHDLADTKSVEEMVADLNLSLLRVEMKFFSEISDGEAENEKNGADPRPEDSQPSIGSFTYCGDSIWKNGEVLIVTGKVCPAERGYDQMEFRNAGELEFDVLSRSGNSLELGARTMVLDASMETKRPVAFDSSDPYVKF